jgi:RNA polymerase sigma-70 factor, ECF subfamily
MSERRSRPKGPRARRWGRRRDPFANPEPLIRRVYAYAAYRIGPGADAEDVTGEVFERALRYEDTFDESKGELVAWLLGIARRCVDDHLARPTTVQLDAVPPAAPDDVETEVVERVALHEALGELAERDRELVSLYYAGLNGGQIAELLCTDRNATDVALHRARGRLRTIIERRQAEEEPVTKVRRRAV